MFKSSSTHYTAVATSPTQKVAEIDGPTEKPKGRGTVVELVLWVLLAVSVSSLWEVNVLIQQARTGLAVSPAQVADRPDIAPPGTLAPFTLETDESTRYPSFLVVYESSSAAISLLPPKVVSLLQRSQPSRIFHNASQQELRAIRVNHDFNVIMQFELPDSQGKLCAIALPPGIENQTLILHGSQRYASVWNVADAPVPLNPSTISYLHHPPRREFIGQIEFGYEHMDGTDAFPCPSDGTVTVLLQCMEVEDCSIKLRQSVDEGSYGVQLAQWSI